MVLLSNLVLMTGFSIFNGVHVIPGVLSATGGTDD